MADFFSVLYLVIFCQGIFLGILLIWLAKKNGKHQLYLISLLVFCISLQLLIYGLSYNKLILGTPHLAGLEGPIPLLYGPILYFYFKYSEQKFKIKLKSLVHLLPFILYIIYRLEFYFLPGEEKFFLLEKSLDISKAVTRSIPISSFIIRGLFITHLTFYIFKCKSILDSIRKVKSSDHQNEFGFPFQIKIFRGFVLYTIFFIVYSVILLSGLGFYNLPCYLTKCLMAFSLYYIGYIFIIHDGFNEPLRHVIKYKNSPLSQDVKDDIWKEVNSYLIDRDMYRSSNLRLSEISQDLGYPVHYISQIINEKSEDNFSAYVNYLRIEYAKNILSTKKDVKISDLIIDSGFNSKSSFYTEFKKYTGLTPLEFKNA